MADEHEHDFQSAHYAIMQELDPRSEQPPVFTHRDARICVKCGIPEIEHQLVQARTLLEEVLKGKEALWNGSEVWNRVSAFLAHKE